MTELEQWIREACERADKHGIGRLAHCDASIITGEKLAELQAKAAQYDRMAAGEDIVGKAAKWDAMQVKLDEHQYNHDEHLREHVKLQSEVAHFKERAVYVGGREVKPAKFYGAEHACEQGPGLAARYPDATKPGTLRSEPITCDLSGDWD